jgi:cytochrome c oxidase subunit 2
MERAERIAFGALILVALLFNAVTLSPLVPWQEWLLYPGSHPARQVPVRFRDYAIVLPPGGVEVRAGEFVEFVATSQDVTYGFGAFRKDGTMVFQMQVVPGHENKLLWKFDAPGSYDVRSTEYSGPRHSEMYVPDAIRVAQ